LLLQQRITLRSKKRNEAKKWLQTAHSHGLITNEDYSALQNEIEPQ
jgi:uncharacterized protein HemY